jgi:hypothetical protein
VGVSPTVAAVCNRHAHAGACKAQQAALPKNGGGQNARATGGPGILPVTKWAHGLSRLNTNQPRFSGTGQDVCG